MRRFTSVLAGCVVLALAAHGSTVLFSDDFETQESLQNWIPESFATGTLRQTVQDGVLRLENEGTAFVMSKHSEEFEDFTYRARLRALSDQYNTVGLVACWTLKSDGYAGYMFTLMEGQLFTVTKWSAGRTTPLYQSWSSHIYAGWNELTISKQGSTLSFLVNGVAVHTVEDATSPSGEIGLALGNLQVAEFDEVVVETGYTEGVRIQAYFDDFGTDALDGWSKTFAYADWDVQGGHLSINANDPSYPAFFYVDGDFASVPVTTALRYGAGDTTQFYGIVLMEIERTFDAGANLNPNRQTLFVISSNREYGAGAGSYIPRTHSAIRGGGAWDTLVVSAAHGLSINGRDISIPDDVRTFDFNAVGIWVGSGVTVEVDFFKAGEPVAVMPRTPVVQRPALVPGGNWPGPVFSLTGRMICNGKETTTPLRSSAAGMVVGRGADNGFARALLTLP